MVESVFRRFKDFDPFKGTPIDMMHNLESGIMKDLLEVCHPTSSRLCHMKFMVGSGGVPVCPGARALHGSQWGWWNGDATPCCCHHGEAVEANHQQAFG